MPVIAMVVTTRRAHPNADQLRIYEMRAPSVDNLVVIANDESTYNPGDTVAVATMGTTLPDGVKIRRTRLRGVDSFGMLLQTVDAAPGTDLSLRFGASEPPPQSTSGGTTLARWPSIELFHAVVRTARELKQAGLLTATPTYRAKVKLDGTNAAIHTLGDSAVAQSRTRLLTVDDDNYGFARWLDTNGGWARSLHEHLGRAVIYGEWAGEGIQQRTAVSKVQRKIFAVFAIQFGDPASDTPRVLADPTAIAALVPAHPDVFVLPYLGQPITMDFADPASLAEAADTINALVAAVEARDPWVAEQFGIDGVGEGVVMYPVDGLTADISGRVDREQLATLLFKAKGEKHRVTRSKVAAQVDPQVAKSVAEFVHLMVTEPRLRQGLDEALGGAADPRRLGEFLRWVNHDVRKESVSELEAAELTWKQVAKAVTAEAKRWLVAHSD